MSLLSKSLQLHCCYLARTTTCSAESLTLPQPGKGMRSTSQVFEASYPKRNMTARTGAQDHQAGEPLEHRFQQALASSSLQAPHCNSSRQLQPRTKLSPISSTCSPQHSYSQACSSPTHLSSAMRIGACRNIGIRPRQTQTDWDKTPTNRPVTKSRTNLISALLTGAPHHSVSLQAGE